YKQGCENSERYARLFADLFPDEMRAGRSSNVHEALPRPHWTSRARHCLYRHQMPAILCEVGFATHAIDRAFIISERGVNVISQYLARATIAAAQLKE
ncbi:hypothetical protein LCGC14_1942300, partial [marine sediment metagenome]